MKTPDTEWEGEFESRFGGEDCRHLLLVNEHVGQTNIHLEVKEFISTLIRKVKAHEAEKMRAWAEVSYKRGYEDGKNNQIQDT